MVGIYGINGIPEPASLGPPVVRGRKSQFQTGLAPSGQDNVLISPEAREASGVAQLLEAAGDQSSDLRAELIAKAQEQLEKGAHRVQNVVRIVAARISKYLAEMEN